jgi:hypothetical protein
VPENSDKSRNTLMRRSIPVSFEVAPFLPATSAPNEMHDQADDGHNEQQVNQRTSNVEGKKAQNPSYQ